MKTHLLIIVFAFSLAGCYSVRDTTNAVPNLGGFSAPQPKFEPQGERLSTSAMFVLDATSICMITSSERWWVKGDRVYAGQWQESKNKGRGHTVTASVQLRPNQQKRLVELLEWLERIDVGIHDVQFGDPGAHLKLTSSPGYAVDYDAPGGRRIIVGDDPVADLEPVINFLNVILPVGSRISWQVTRDAYVLKKRPPKLAAQAATPENNLIAWP